MPVTKPGIVLPREWERSKPSGRRRWSPTMGLAVLRNPDFSIAWQEDEWQVNALHDAGEQDLLQVFLAEQAHKEKWLGLLNDASLAETDGTMGAVTETKTAGTGGYARQRILAGDWTNDGLQSGDYRFSAAEKTFGAVTTAAATVTHASLSSTETGNGILFLTIALQATTTVAVGQFFDYILRTTAS